MAFASKQCFTMDVLVLAWMREFSLKRKELLSSREIFEAVVLPHFQML